MPKKWLILAIIIGIVAFLSITSFFAYQSYQQKNLKETNSELSEETTVNIVSGGIEYSDPCETGDKKGCIMETVYSKIKKSSELAGYTIIWNESFSACEENPNDKSILFSVEQCKLDVCDNLQFGDGNIKYDYPESEACKKEAIKNSTCSDGQKNGRETDLDCGGPDCNPCNIDNFCKSNNDCSTGICNLNGITYRYRCIETCPDGPIKNNAPCGCQVKEYKPQGYENKLEENWETQYGNGKTLFCCNGAVKELSPNQSCPL